MNLKTETILLFRILLFKIFNKIETWERLESAFGAITLKEFKFGHYDEVLGFCRLRRCGSRNAASGTTGRSFLPFIRYISPCGTAAPEFKKVLDRDVSAL